MARIAGVDLPRNKRVGIALTYIHGIGRVTVWQAGCNGYYRSPSGRVVTQWPFSMTEFRRRTAEPDPDAFEVAAR